ncbi:hypothetical protein B0H13DRAFT_2329921 [Mycena leptocephala]|nr:hypothetical protein B0H13DRAFT_2329921 [Mycena leptocephala]
MSSPLDSTYGVSLAALFLETILYGMGVLQGWIYFADRPVTDSRVTKALVLIVLALETIQVVFFFRSSYFRFVERFGQIQIDLIWADSLQLLAAYLSAFTVQMYTSSSIFYQNTADRCFLQLLRHSNSQANQMRAKLSLLAIGIYTIACYDPPTTYSFVHHFFQLTLDVVQILAGIAQTILSYDLRSFEKLGETKAVTTLQTAASLACDLLITTYLCVFLGSKKGEMMKTNTMMDLLIRDAINRGALTALSSGVTMVLFLALPDTFWFFLGLAPSSKLYMNSMLATLNMRKRTREKLDTNDKGWNSIPLGTVPTINGPKKIQGHSPIAAVDFETNSMDMPDKMADFPEVKGV